jgi:hypothetical protein
MWPWAIKMRLWQEFPGALTPVTLYTVPASIRSEGTPLVMIDSIYISNLDFQDGEDLISVRIVPSWQSIQNKYAIANNYPIQKAENLIKDKIFMNTWDSIVVQSAKWKSSFMAFGELDMRQVANQWFEHEIVILKNKVVAGTDTPGDREKLMLLTWWAYVIQTNTNSCP